MKKSNNNNKRRNHITSFGGIKGDGTLPRVYRSLTLTGVIGRSLTPEIRFQELVYSPDPSPRIGSTLKSTDDGTDCGTNIEYSLGLIP